MNRRGTALPVVLLTLTLLGCAEDTDGASPSAAPTSAASSPDDSSTPSSAPAATTAAPVDDVKTFEVSVAGGKVTRRSSTFELRRGDRARIVVTSDTADEVHLHSYDVKVDVAPGAAATLEFTATIPGQFEVELEKAGLLLVMVSVR